LERFPEPGSSVTHIQQKFSSYRGPQEFILAPYKTPSQSRQTDWEVLGKQRLLPVLQFLFHLILGDAVSFLQLADELVTFAIDDIQVVVGQFAPFFLNLAF
jgi:hypothetical protein